MARAGSSAGELREALAAKDLEIQAAKQALEDERKKQQLSLAKLNEYILSKRTEMSQSIEMQKGKLF